jgi:hypothetical protein
MDSILIIGVFGIVLWAIASCCIFSNFIHYTNSVDSFSAEICLVKNVTSTFMVLTFENLVSTLLISNSSFYLINQTLACYVSFDDIRLELNIDQSLFVAGCSCYAISLIFFTVWLIIRIKQYMKRKNYDSIEEEHVERLEPNNPNDPKLALESFQEAQRLLWRDQDRIPNFTELRKFQIEALLNKNFEEEFQKKVYNALLEI